MGNTNFSITYETDARDRPLSVIRVHRAAGDPRRGWLTADGWTVPVALGRGGILANKREGDGGTPRGIFRPLQLWWRADRHPRPQTFLPARPIRPEDAWCEDPADRHYNQPIRLARSAGRRPADARGSPLRLHRRDRSQQRPRIAGRGSAVFLHLARTNFSADRGLRFDDEICDAAAVAADGTADQNRYWLNFISGSGDHARQEPDCVCVEDAARPLARRHQV